MPQVNPERRNQAIDLLIVGSLIVGSLVQILTTDGDNSRWADSLAAAAIVSTLYWRRSHSRLVASAIAAGLVVQAVAWESTDLICVIIAVVVAVYSVAVYNTPGVAMLPTALLGAGIAFSILTDSTDEPVNILPTLLIFVGLPFIAGQVQYRRHLDIDGLQKNLEIRTGQAVAEERLRIARELHDVVAHNISVIAIQTDAASAAIRSSPERAIEPLSAIRRAALDALSEMQQMLVVLRDPDAQPAHSPPRGLDSIPQLVGEVRATGVGVEYVQEGERRVVNAGVSHCAYRVVQEGLTNAMKHAAGSQIRVSEVFDSDVLVVSVEDDGGVGASGGSGGLGLVGLRERVGLINGQLHAGSAASGWSLRARLPIDSARIGK